MQKRNATSVLKYFYKNEPGLKIFRDRLWVWSFLFVAEVARSRVGFVNGIAVQTWNVTAFWKCSK